MVEMFGLKKPLPTMTRPRARYRSCVWVMAELTQRHQDAAEKTVLLAEVAIGQAAADQRREDRRASCRYAIDVASASDRCIRQRLGQVQHQDGSHAV